jgi:hypothetical protein
MDLTFCLKYDELKDCNTSNSIFLIIESSLLRRGTPNVLQEVKWDSDNRLHATVISGIQPQKDEVTFWYNTIKEILNTIKYIVPSNKTLIVNAPGEHEKFNDLDGYYEVVINNRMVGIMQALVEYQSMMGLSFCITYFKEARMKRAIYNAYMTAVDVNNQIALAEFIVTDYNDNFIADVIKLIIRDLNLVNKMPKAINLVNGFYDPVQDFYYQHKKIKLPTKRFVQGKYDTIEEQIVIFLPEIKRITTNSLDYHTEIIIVLAHEIRHHWQKINLFEDDGDKLSHEHRREELDADQYSHIFLVKNYKYLLKLFKKYFYKSFRPFDNMIKKDMFVSSIKFNIDYISTDLVNRREQRIQKKLC